MTSPSASAADSVSPQRDRAGRLPASLQRTLVVSGLGLASGGAIAFVVNMMRPVEPAMQLTEFLFRQQDLPWLVAISAFLVASGLLSARLRDLPVAWMAALSPRAATILMTAATVLCGWLGARFVFEGGFHLTRDEIMADFDAAIFRAGYLIAPVASEWRAYATALSPRFMQPISDDAGLISQYLPGNALIRALFGGYIDPTLISPLLAAIAVLATYGVARRLWPDRKDVAILAPLLVVTSSQVLIMSMTSYAMTAHLALNMLWLWLFLRDDKLGHGGAIAVGALACGLHQVVFHPIFVYPFILRLFQQSRHRLAFVYVGSYALICLFWIMYPQFALSVSDMSPKYHVGAGLSSFALRALIQLGDIGSSIVLTPMNLVRFVVWENPILIPLALFSLAPVRRGQGVAYELARGVAMTFIAMAVVMPYQGHGWGYRYAHGVIGSLALLACYGWVEIVDKASDSVRAGARRLVALASVASIVVLLPAHASDVHAFIAPYARARAAIAQADADIVIVDKFGLNFAEDLVRNDPLLRDRPKTLDLAYIAPKDIAPLCATHRVALFAQPQGAAFGIRPAMNPDDPQDFAAGRAELARLGCGAPLAIPPAAP